MSAGPVLVQRCTDGDLPGDILHHALELHYKACLIERSARRSFIDLGVICNEIKSDGLWRFLAAPDGNSFHSWEHWATCTLDVCRRSAFAAVRVIEATKGVPIEDLQQMTRRNMQHFARLSTQVQAEVVEQAKTLPEKEFIHLIQDKHPEQHLDHKAKITLEFDAAALPEIEALFAKVMEMEKLSSYEEVVENYLRDYELNHRGE